MNRDLLKQPISFKFFELKHELNGTPRCLISDLVPEEIEDSKVHTIRDEKGNINRLLDYRKHLNFHSQQAIRAIVYSTVKPTRGWQISFTAPKAPRPHKQYFHHIFSDVRSHII